VEHFGPSVIISGLACRFDRPSLVSKSEKTRFFWGRENGIFWHEDSEKKFFGVEIIKKAKSYATLKAHFLA
jgi:hypothetical protein